MKNGRRKRENKFSEITGKVAIEIVLCKGPTPRDSSVDSKGVTWLRNKTFNLLRSDVCGEEGDGGVKYKLAK
jgi:hypothetical protein